MQLLILTLPLVKLIQPFLQFVSQNPTTYAVSSFSEYLPKHFTESRFVFQYLLGNGDDIAIF